MFVDPDGREAEQCCSWNNTKRFFKGAWNTGTAMVKDAIFMGGLSGGISKSVKDGANVAKSYQQGGFKSAVKQTGSLAYEGSGAKGIIQMAKRAAKGNPEAIGSLSVMAAAVIITHKAGGKAATVTETEAALVSKTVTVTQESVTQALKNSNLQTAQGVVSGPMVERCVQMAQDGSVAPPIKVTSNGIIVDGNHRYVAGNHRYVAGKLTGNEPAQIPGTLSPSQQSKVQPVQNTKVDPNDWEGY